MHLPPPFDQFDEDSTKKRSLAKANALFRQGDPTRGLFVLVSGRLELRRVTELGSPVLIHNVRAGETFAEASLFSSEYHCDAIALEDSQLIEFSRQEVLARFQNQPEFAMALARQFASQIQIYRRKMEILAIRDAAERVYAGICEGLLHSDIKSLAAEIGLTHEAVYRSLAILVRQGRLMKSARGTYQLLPTRN